MAQAGAVAERRPEIALASKEVVTLDDVKLSSVSAVRGVLQTPIVVVRTLIQLGYEPVQEYADQNIFHQNGFRRLGLFAYGQNIYARQGLGGLFVGWRARGLNVLFYTLTRGCLRKTLYPRIVDESVLAHDANPSLAKVTKVYLQEVIVDSVSSCLAVLVTHPFEVVSTRMIAQLAGGESLYTGLIQALLRIYREEGLAGLYSGVLPALLGEVVFAASTNLVYRILQTYVLPLLSPPDEIRPHLKALMSSTALAIANPAYYPPQTIKAMMIVNGSKLRLASAPFVPGTFKSSADCASYLFRLDGWSARGIMRGSNIIRRFFTRNIPAAMMGSK